MGAIYVFAQPDKRAPNKIHGWPGQDTRDLPVARPRKRRGSTVRFSWISPQSTSTAKVSSLTVAFLNVRVQENPWFVWPVSVNVRYLRSCLWGLRLAYL